ncbi:uncharacterized protein LOC123696190 isoform X1 [Colias croceus]|uniref:uncharacterized protein LOC123696190 isoform X1 n=2 Tax=Colias crocea TaxID=72248 RepID=UPI001E281ABE|nr:uncharacterized protein LOC123696190 isoform X1 [Colias croceus]
MDLSIFNNIEISDPTCKDQISILLEDLRIEEEDFIEKLVEKQDSMIITWEQPWYQKTGWLTRRLKQSSDDEKFCEDKMSKAECDRIHKNWKKFVKQFNLPNKPMCLARWRNKDKNKRGQEEKVRRFVISYLAQKLERNLYQVFHYFVAKYASPNRGKYTELELKIIKMCIYHFPKNGIQYASRILCREPRGIYKRLAEDCEEHLLHRNKEKWSLPLATKFLKHLMDYSGYSLEELKYKRFDTSIWKKLEKDMDKYYLTLQKFWYYYLHVQLFVKQDVKIRKLRKKILLLLRKYPYQVWTDIRWKEIQKHFPDGMTNNFLYDTTTRAISKYENYLTSPIENIIEYGLVRIKQDSNKRLRTVILNSEGMLEVINYKKSNNNFTSQNEN